MELDDATYAKIFDYAFSIKNGLDVYIQIDLDTYVYRLYVAYMEAKKYYDKYVLVSNENCSNIFRIDKKAFMNPIIKKYIDYNCIVSPMNGDMYFRVPKNHDALKTIVGKQIFKYVEQYKPLVMTIQNSSKLLHVSSPEELLVNVDLVSN